MVITVRAHCHPFGYNIYICIYIILYYIITSIYVCQPLGSETIKVYGRLGCQTNWVLNHNSITTKK